MRQDKHCCYQNDRNIVLIPFCLQLLIWSLWASQINSVIHPGILPALKEIPSKTIQKTFSKLFPNLWTSAPQKTSELAWKRWFLYFPSAHLSGGNSTRFQHSWYAPLELLLNKCSLLLPVKSAPLLSKAISHNIQAPSEILHSLLPCFLSSYFLDYLFPLPLQDFSWHKM